MGYYSLDPPLPFAVIVNLNFHLSSDKSSDLVASSTKRRVSGFKPVCDFFDVSMFHPLSEEERCVTTLIYVTTAKETILELFASSQFFSTQKRGLRGFACYKLANQTAHFYSSRCENCCS